MHTSASFRLCPVDLGPPSGRQWFTMLVAPGCVPLSLLSMTTFSQALSLAASEVAARTQLVGHAVNPAENSRSPRVEPRASSGWFGVPALQTFSVWLYVFPYRGHLVISIYLRRTRPCLLASLTRLLGTVDGSWPLNTAITGFHAWTLLDEIWPAEALRMSNPQERRLG
ncbi:hypothetical protein BD311DRAFT_383147 [Dichomitus squalens]|uniref:Uncharacterized protein n=1 Tax=Dichomitus squalens TaxID=114155 RepID=A0A4Q9MIM1_9APHY|nr:hypothetical protein BD311DRAFT_383147 [Dichomitus squalens]